MLSDEQMAALRWASSGESLHTHTHIAGIPAFSMVAHIDAQSARIAALEADRGHARQWSEWWQRCFLRGKTRADSPKVAIASDGWSGVTCE